LTSSLFENKDGYCFWKTRRKIEGIRPTVNDDTTTTTTENFAVLGCPAPNSFDTLTLIAALNPIATISTQPTILVHMESESTAISAFFKYPAKSTNAEHYSRRKR
jgi:hypothetical protein